MNLEQALGLKKGTKLLATEGWMGEFELTKGKTYTLLADAKRIPGKRDAELTIIDDRGEEIKIKYKHYMRFEVVS